MKVELNDLMTPTAFAKMHGVTVASISIGMNSGLIPFVQINGARLILWDDETKLYRPRRDGRRPVKNQSK